MRKRRRFAQIDADERVVRTSGGTRRSRRKSAALVALGGFLNGFSAGLVDVGSTFPIRNLCHGYIFVRTSRCADATADANGIVYRNDPRPLIAGDRAGRASDHANRIAAMHTGLDKLQAVVNQALPDKARITVVDVGASFDAIIATCATMQINDHRVATIVQPILNDKFKQLRRLETDACCMLDVGRRVAREYR